MSSSESGSNNLDGLPSPPLTAGVLARLEVADRQRAQMRRTQRHQQMAGIAAAILLLAACLGAQGSDVATHALAWIYASALAWKGLVTAALGGLVLLPLLSASCLLGMAVVLWQRVLSTDSRSLHEHR